MRASTPRRGRRTTWVGLAAILALTAALLPAAATQTSLVQAATKHPKKPTKVARVAAASPAPPRTGATIAIVDSGVDPLPSLSRALAPGYDFVDADATPDDGNGHGTAMASIAAAEAGGTVVGVCSTCKVLPVRVIGNGGSGTTALVAAGVRWATAAHARVINLSLTTPVSDPDLAAAIQDAVSAGSVVVTAAGNSGSSDPAANGYPAAAAPEAISVAGVDGSERLYPWSNHGSWVELAAPGMLGALTLGGAAFTAVGTSAAAAYVSGVVGAMLSANPSLTPAQVESILLATATVAPGLDVRSGRVVDARAAVVGAALG